MSAPETPGAALQAALVAGVAATGLRAFDAAPVRATLPFAVVEPPLLRTRGAVGCEGVVERAGEGKLEVGEIVGLFWHCLRDRPEGVTRESLGEAVVACGLQAAMPALRLLLGQIVLGR